VGVTSVTTGAVVSTPTVISSMYFSAAPWLSRATTWT
jgi:hypothetical protein